MSNEPILRIEFTYEDGVSRLVIEDDGTTGYAFYVRANDEPLGFVWLYNVGTSVDLQPVQGPPPNPARYARDQSFLRPEATDFGVYWSERKQGRECAVYIRGQLHAVLGEWTEPGWCVLAARDGRLARVMEPPDHASKHPLERLLDLCGNALAVRGADTDFPADLSRLLSLRNGFYSKEAALHVFPTIPSNEEVDLHAWNAILQEAFSDLAEGLFFLAEDLFGNQFAYSDAGIVFFDIETAQRELIAKDIEDWASLILTDYDYYTGSPLAEAFADAHGEFPDGYRLVPKQMFCLGGEYELENLDALPAVEAARFRGHVALQLREVPDGTLRAAAIELNQ